MEQRFSLEAAGKLMGVSANAMRARAKKNPDQYRFERDNSGKIWLWIDPEKFPTLKPSKLEIKGSENSELKASIEGLISKIEAASNAAELKAHIQSLEARIKELEAEKAGNDALLVERLNQINKQDVQLAQNQKRIDSLIWDTQRSWWQRLFGQSKAEEN